VGKFSSLFGGGDEDRQSSATQFSAPPAPTPTGPTGEEKEAARRIRVAEKQRRGRRATILASRQEDPETLGVSARRPQARAALLGGG